MAAVPTQSELADAIEALRPDQEQAMADWYIQRRELVVRRVLERAGEPDVVVPAARSPRKRRRTLLAGGLAVALLGGGTAWAYSNYAAWYPGGTLDGFTCLTTWHEPDLARGGPTSTAGSGSPRTRSRTANATPNSPASR